MFKIRPFEATDSEYEAITAVHNAVWPNWERTVEELKHADETQDPELLYQRFVVEVGEGIVGMGLGCEPLWSQKPGKYFLSCYVQPDHRRAGIGGALYEHIVRFLAKFEPLKLVAATREDQPEGLRFLTKRGFQQVMRDEVSRLDVTRFDPGRFSGTRAKVETLGIRILPLSEIVSLEPDWKHKLEALEWDLLQDLPSPDPLTRLPFEMYEQRVLGSPNFMPEGNFVALDGDRWVGLTALWRVQADSRKLDTGLTGVVRSHRRKGIATALKVQAIEYAQGYGIELIETENEENNPMYLLNLKLGFEPQPAWLNFEKRLAAVPQREGTAKE